MLAAVIAMWGAGSCAGQTPASMVPGQTPPAPRDSELDALLSEGAGDLDRGQIAQARAAFERVLKIDPANTAAHTYLGVIADKEGQIADAERHFSVAAISDPFSPSTHNNLGAVLLKLGKKQQAAAQFTTSLRLNPDQPSALVNLAQIRVSSGTDEDLRAARGLFDRAAAAAPDAEISRALVAISLRLGERAAAARYYQTYVGQIASGDSAVSSAPLRAELGAALLKGGLVDEAVQELAAAQAASRGSSAATTVLLARAYLAHNDIAAAGRTLESAVIRGVANAAVYAALADVYEKSGRMEHAIPVMHIAVEREPKSEEFWFRYGMLLTDSRAPAAAVIRLHEALKLLPKSSRLWFALGVAHLAENRTDEASKAFNRALEIDPRFAPALAYLGMSAAEEGRYADAVGFYQRSLAIDDASAVTHYLLADSLLNQTSADTRTIEMHLTRAVTLDPKFAPARVALGKLYSRESRLPEAAEQLERSVALNPNLVQAHYQLAQVYRRMKKATESESELATFKRLSDSQKEQSEADRRDIVRRLANVRF